MMVKTCLNSNGLGNICSVSLLFQSGCCGYNPAFAFLGYIMPIYDYQCSHCGFKQEVMRKVSEPSITDCPQCQQNTFTKQLSAPSFQLNGTGWYATDFKGSKQSKQQPNQAEAPACGSGCACH